MAITAILPLLGLLAAPARAASDESPPLLRVNTPAAFLAAETTAVNQRSLWEEYQGIIIGTAMLISTSLLLNVLLLLRMLRRQHWEKAWHQSETGFRRVANSVPAMIWTTGPDQAYTFCNKAWLDFTGCVQGQALGAGWLKRVHRDDRESYRQRYSEAFANRCPFKVEYRFQTYEGDYRWIIDQGLPRFAPDGTFLGYIGSALDIDPLKAAEAELRTTQEDMTLVAEVACLGMWVWDILGNWLWMSENCRKLFGFPAEGEITYKALLQRIHPEDREAADEAVRGAIAEKRHLQIEYRVLLSNGTTRWIAATGQVEHPGLVTPLRLLGICIDISERRRAEEAARELGGRLINAQEEERRRIARDLHDDLNQRLALLSVDMELLHAGQDEAHDQRLDQVAERVKELSSEVHKLAYQLHPAKLDQLGLVAAARSFCRELSRQSGVRIDFIHASVPRDIPNEIALCLYRIIQESSQNVVRHSGAQEAKVYLQGTEGMITLSIVDSGKGFDTELGRRKGGLGLISMEERIRLVHGSIAIRSQPGVGTQINLKVPVAKGTVFFQTVGG